LDFQQPGYNFDAYRLMVILIVMYLFRKFAVSDRLPFVINEVVDQTIEIMLKEKQPFNPIIFIDFMTYNILAYTAYGTK